ncbi:hypothetical protein L1277_002787 [Okibacterium sp. HSC-33S16]|uniref:M23 family metallopeptidase n=1 Tax=Okibacterium sp. HSC-33S16 TaxID=2910965 RepID=UPI00209CBFFD|nr:M23 family metallopeptidase [Okibacterium sp. HSC-33S16]MCP2032677.1 hypothetical protein [Okibacterium sp. HSC-33S16]
MAQQTEEPGQSLVLELPFTGRWLVQNSPARRVPSHGTDLLGGRYAIDFVGVTSRRRTSDVPSWQSAFGVEPPERLVSFGRSILSPCAGVVVEVHDGEPDHVARRSPLAALPYLLAQRARLAQGVAAVAGNFVLIQLSQPDTFVALVHLRQHSIRVREGDRIATGQRLAECGNSGNSTQPHLHLQAMSSRDLSVAYGLPIVFRRYREQRSRSSAFQPRAFSIPAEGSVIEP